MSSDPIFMDEPPSCPKAQHLQRSQSCILGIADKSGKKRGSLTFASSVSQLKRAGTSRTGLGCGSDHSCSSRSPKCTHKKNHSDDKLSSSLH
eukprot:scaffold344_cov130-Cylindrotheca_fusiformis.AAC.9